MKKKRFFIDKYVRYNKLVHMLCILVLQYVVFILKAQLFNKSRFVYSNHQKRNYCVV